MKASREFFPLVVGVFFSFLLFDECGSFIRESRKGDFAEKWRKFKCFPFEHVSIFFSFGMHPRRCTFSFEYYLYIEWIFVSIVHINLRDKRFWLWERIKREQQQQQTRRDAIYASHYCAEEKKKIHAVCIIHERWKSARHQHKRQQTHRHTDTLSQFASTDSKWQMNNESERWCVQQHHVYGVWYGCFGFDAISLTPESAFFTNAQTYFFIVVVVVQI